MGQVPSRVRPGLTNQFSRHWGLQGIRTSVFSQCRASNWEREGFDWASSRMEVLRKCSLEAVASGQDTLRPSQHSNSYFF